MTYVITAMVITDDPGQATLAAELLSRAGAGLLLNGVTVNLSLTVPVDEDEAEEHDEQVET